MEVITIKKKRFKTIKRERKKNFNKKPSYKPVNLDLKIEEKYKEKIIEENNKDRNLILKSNRVNSIKDTMNLKKNKSLKEPEAKINELPVIQTPTTTFKEEFYFLDNNELLKNIITNNNNNDEDFILITKNENNDLINGF